MNYYNYDKEESKIIKIIQGHKFTDKEIRHLVFNKKTSTLRLYRSKDDGEVIAILHDFNYDNAVNVSNEYGLSLIKE
jgi:predicted transcriptional regulator